MTQKTLILAVETSSRVGSVAMAINKQLLAEVTFSGPMKHSAELFPAIHTLLERLDCTCKEIEQVYISIGPGSFTGLRIAVTLAKAMHLAGSVKIVPVDTLDVIASNVINLDYPNKDSRVKSPETVAPILDAKRGQFYTAVYQRTADGTWNKTIPDSLMTCDKFLQKFACSQKPVWLLGDGLVYHKDKFKADGFCFFDEELWCPHASKVHQLGWQLSLANKFADPLVLTPNYLIRPNVTLKRR